MLHQQVEISLDDGLRDESVKHETVYAVLLNTCNEQGRKEERKICILYSRLEDEAQVYVIVTRSAYFLHCITTKSIIHK